MQIDRQRRFMVERWIKDSTKSRMRAVELKQHIDRLFGGGTLASWDER